MTAPVPRPTSRGLAALAAFGLVVASAVLTGTPELAPLAVLIGAPLAVSPLLVRRRARRSLADAEFHAHVEPAAVEVGTGMQVKLALTNRSPGSFLPPLGIAPVTGRWRARGVDHDRSRRHHRIAPSVSSLSALPDATPGSTESLLLDVPTGRRGVLELPAQHTWVHDPFGLVGAQGPSTPVVLAAVYPAPIRPDQAIGDGTVPVAGTLANGRPTPAGGLGELEGIRPYVVGDRLILLHWPAMARYGTWFVRQFGGDGGAAHSIVLDDRIGVHRRADFERLVSVALGAVDEMTRGHRAVHLSTLSGTSYSFEATDRGRTSARLVLAELRPAAARDASRFAAPPPDTVLLTTRTGAERLVHGRTGRRPSAPTDARRGFPGPTSRVVVV